jgi:hypothetical protein
MKASQEPLEETKVGGGDLVIYPTLPGKPVQSQDTLRRKLLKACAGSNPTWIGAPSCSFSCQILCPHETGPDSALQGKTPSDPHTGWSLPSLAVPSAMPTSAFGTPPCRRWFYTRVSVRLLLKCCWYDFLILPASDSTRFVRLSQVAQVRKKRGALHRTIITKHLQGKVRSNLRKRKRWLPPGVSDHTLSRHNFPPMDCSLSIAVMVCSRP